MDVIREMLKELDGFSVTTKKIVEAKDTKGKLEFFSMGNVSVTTLINIIDEEGDVDVAEKLKDIQCGIWEKARQYPSDMISRQGCLMIDELFNIDSNVSETTKVKEEAKIVMKEYDGVLNISLKYEIV